ncbi:MAG: DNA-processing protein DprA [Candidatus Peribacteraceae bacterium]
MDPSNALRWSVMNILTMKRYTALLEAYQNLDNAMEMISEEMLGGLGLKEQSVMKALNRLEECDPDVYLRELQKRDVRLITIEDEEYPTLLRTIPDAPVFLYARGDTSILRQPCIALVGTREMTAYGEQAVSMLIPDLVRAGTVTVSGLAYGIDAEVARETIHAGGETVAVLGHGFGTIYPKEHAKLADQIVDGGGVLLSEYPLDIEPDKYTFPARNRIIAGLALATVVVEADEGSGSLITAELALEYGREVAAIPGRITDTGHKGCHHLITTGQAKLITSAHDILIELGIVASERAEHTSITFDSPEEEAVHQSLTTLPIPVDDLVIKTKLDAATLNAVLTMLELKGATRRLSGGTWVRS